MDLGQSVRKDAIDNSLRCLPVCREKVTRSQSICTHDGSPAGNYCEEVAHVCRVRGSFWEKRNPRGLIIVQYHMMPAEYTVSKIDPGNSSAQCSGNK